MKVSGKHYTSIWPTEGVGGSVSIIDQRYLPHQFIVKELASLQEACSAIRDMEVRGAPLIGLTASFGIYLAIRESASDSLEQVVKKAAAELAETRPTAVNLFEGIRRQVDFLDYSKPRSELLQDAFNNAMQLFEEEKQNSYQIGLNGVKLIEEISKRKNGEPVQILTHCNAGWIACVDYGTATAPVYEAYERKIPVHVWVDETRPRNQGAGLTAWELGEHGVPHSVVVDNAGGHLMQHGMVDLVLVGSDRTTRSGDVANKIGTYIKALAAHESQVPFYVTLPSTTIDWEISDGVKEIPIEERSEREVSHIQGKLEDGDLASVQVTPDSSRCRNFAFDVTPAKFVTGLVTERGICQANEQDIMRLYPERNN